MSAKKLVADLFDPKREQWGLRGDPFLWQDLSRAFQSVPVPDSRETLEAMLLAAFLALTGRPVSTEEMFYVERYAHGGMSSGQICPEFWRERGIPLLLSRYVEPLNSERP